MDLSFSILSKFIFYLSDHSRISHFFRWYTSLTSWKAKDDSIIKVKESILYNHGLKENQFLDIVSCSLIAGLPLCHHVRNLGKCQENFWVFSNVRKVSEISYYELSGDIPHLKFFCSIWKKSHLTYFRSGVAY